MPNHPLLPVDPRLAVDLFTDRFTYSADTVLDALAWSLFRAKGIAHLAEISLEELNCGGDPRAICLAESVTNAVTAVRMEIQNCLTLVNYGPLDEPPSAITSPGAGQETLEGQS